MLREAIFGTVLAAAFAAASAQAINPNSNVRPTIVNTAPAGEASLGTILNGSGTAGPLFPGYTFDIANGQSTAGMWGSASPGVATTIPTLVIEYAGFASINRFGIWFGTDASNLRTFDLLLGPATAGSFAAISIQQGHVDVIGFGCGTAVNCSGSNGWNDARISPTSFGFYFQTGNGPRVYSLDSLNANGESRFLSYQAGASTNWVFAYEDIGFTNGSDRDYNDMVVKVESIVAVPEASTTAMLAAGLGLLGFVAARRRRGA